MKFVFGWVFSFVLACIFYSFANAADNKISELTAASAVSSDDLSVIVDDPGGSAATKKITWANIAGSAPFSSLYQGLDADLTDLADGSLTGSKVSDADDDGSTKGVANYTDVDFDATSGAVSIASAITRDTEWDTLSEINTATTDLDAASLTGMETLTNKTITIPKVDNGATSAGYIEFREDTDNGTNYIRVLGVDNVGTNRNLTLPDATDTLVGKDTTDTLTNKTISAASNVIEADSLKDADHGDFTCASASCTVDSNSIALSTDTTGNYVLDVADGTGIDGTASGEGATYTPSLDLTEITCGAGLSCGAATTIATASSEADFLASGALTCGASTQGKIQVHTTPLQYCDNAATPTIQYAAYGNSSGVATSSTALAANGSNCSAGSAPLGVDASGASESCTDYEEDLSNSAGLRGALSDESGTGAAIFADGAIGAATATTPSANDDDTSVATTAYVQTELNAAGGNFLTCASGSCDVDAEAVTDTVCFRITSPTGTDFQSAWVNRSGKTFTVSDLWCESDQTVNMMTQVDDGSVADMDTVDLACISTPDTDSSLDGDATVANGDRVDIDVASVSGTPTWVEFCMTGAYAD